MTATLPALTEAAFMRQVTELAELLGWQWAHFRPAMRANGRWYTPVSGPLGKGWPDLVLVRERDRRLIFAELKRDGAYPTPEQRAVMETLDALTWAEYWREPEPPYSHASGSALSPSIEAHIWRPRDWDDIERCLR